jgi:hypothetical protein
MYVPFSSERSAFWVTLGTAALVGAAIVVGVLTVALAGVLVLLAGLIAAVAADVVMRSPARRKPLRDAAQASRGTPPGRRRILVVANDSLAGDELRERIGEPPGRAFLDILAPVRCSRSHYLTSDYDREAEEARIRLKKSLTWAAAEGFEAYGEVGDGDPLDAIADELREVGADEVMFVAHPRDRATWLDARELRRIRDELDVPVTEVVVTGSGGR